MRTTRPIMPAPSCSRTSFDVLDNAQGDSTQNQRRIESQRPSETPHWRPHLAPMDGHRHRPGRGQLNPHGRSWTVGQHGLLRSRLPRLRHSTDEAGSLLAAGATRWPAGAAPPVPWTCPCQRCPSRMASAPGPRGRPWGPPLAIRGETAVAANGETSWPSSIEAYERAGGRCALGCDTLGNTAPGRATAVTGDTPWAGHSVSTGSAVLAPCGTEEAASCRAGAASRCRLSACVRPRWPFGIVQQPCAGLLAHGPVKVSGRGRRRLTRYFRCGSLPMLNHAQLVAGTWPSCVSSDSMS
jgi:hypothetical protein